MLISELHKSFGSLVSRCTLVIFKHACLSYITQQYYPLSMALVRHLCLLTCKSVMNMTMFFHVLITEIHNRTISFLYKRSLYILQYSIFLSGNAVLKFMFLMHFFTKTIIVKNNNDFMNIH
jgi:hypothetical protein